MKTYKIIINIATAKTKYPYKIATVSKILELELENEELYGSELLEHFEEEFDFNGTLIPNAVKELMWNIWREDDLANFITTETRKKLRGIKNDNIPEVMKDFLEDHNMVFGIEYKTLN